MTPSRCRAYLRDLQRFGIKLGLDSMRTVLAAFGDPHRAYPSVHVAGTNGKGSVCAMLTGILAAGGRKVGLYTSPHLVRVEERIQVVCDDQAVFDGRVVRDVRDDRVVCDDQVGGANRVAGRLISSRDFCRLAGTVKARIERLLARRELGAPPTFFEVLTLIAFLYFREREVDVAVLEVGMGGRFDATNVVTPLVSVITSVSRDHQEHLGPTLAAIAFEKAGIIKPGVPVVCGAEARDAVRVVRAQAAGKSAPLTMVFGRKRPLTREKTNVQGMAFRYEAEGTSLRLAPGLPGAHQGRNAAIAASAVLVLGRVWRPISRSAIVRGVARARWEGRLETVARNPRVLLDGAHNEGGAAALRAYLEELRPPRLVLVFTMMKDKAVGRVAGRLFPLADRIVLTTIPFARAAEPAEILRRARPFRDRILVEPSLPKAIALARAEAGRRGTVLITGSLFLVGAVKKLGPIR
jgi:dihydrofolate synthase/folylpolyglutamate synthase